MNLDQLAAENEARRKVFKDCVDSYPMQGDYAVLGKWCLRDNACEVIDQLIAEVCRLTQGET